MEEKNIIYITMDFINPIFSGNGTLSRIQIFGLADKGYKIFVICPQGDLKNDIELKSYIDQKSIILHEKRISSEKNLSITCDWQGFNTSNEDLDEKIANFKPDLIIAPDWHTIDLAISIKEKYKVPIISQFYRIFSFFEEYHDSQASFEIIKNKELRMLNESQLIVVLCNIDKDWVIKNGINDDMIEILYPPVLDYFLNELRKADSLKENVDINSKNNTQNTQNKLYKPFTVARIVRDKKIHRLFPILKELKQMNFPFQYNFVGEKLDDEYWEFLIESIKKEELFDNIKFDGKKSIPELIQIYKRSDCYIHTSEYEPFGITIIEAALTRCPIFLDYEGLIGASEVLVKNFNVDNIDSLLEAGENIKESDIINGAFPIDYKQPKISASRIIKILNNPKLLEYTTKKARILANILNKENYINNLNDIVENLVKFP